MSPDGLLEIPAAFLHEKGVIRLHEEEGTDLYRLAMQLLDGEYPKPFVIDDGKIRRLHFSLALVQSEMLIADPWSLHLAYTREMMAFLLFLPRPRHVVIVGLGGGSLTKFCYRHLPRTRVTTVELSSDVIAFREQFALPFDDERQAIVCADAVEYFATTEEEADVVLLDGYDDNGIVPAFCDERFYAHLHASLSPRGILVCNLALRGEDRDAHLDLLSESFDGRVRVLDVAGDGNRIAFAFNDPNFAPDWTHIRREARALREATGLAFDSFARRLADRTRLSRPR